MLLGLRALAMRRCAAVLLLWGGVVSVMGQQTVTWSSPNNAGNPSENGYGASFVAHDRMYTLGGFSSQNGIRTMATIWAYDFPTQVGFVVVCGFFFFGGWFCFSG
jgi:hypothetical protein